MPKKRISDPLFGQAGRVALAMATLLTGVSSCGGGGGGGGGGTNPTDSALELSTGAAASLDADATALTFELSGDFESVRLVSPLRVEAERFGRLFFVWNVPLARSESSFTFEGRTASGDVATRALTVRNAPDPRPAVALTSEPSVPVAGAPLEVRLRVRDGLAIGRFLLDLDGDGNLEASGDLGDGLVQISAAPGGVWQTRVAVQDERGLWMANAPGEVIWGNGDDVPPPQPIAWEVPPSFTSASDADTWRQGGTAWLLSSDSHALHEFSALGEHLHTVVLGSTVAATGFCVDANGDLYVVDAPAARVLRYSRASDYALDAGFAGQGELGERGNGPTQLSEPTDVALGMDPGTAGERWICVSDSGNARLQLFGLDGHHLRTIGGPSEDPLQRPGHMVTVAGSAFAVLDGGRVRLFSGDGTELEGLEPAPGSSTSSTGTTSLALDRTHLEFWVHDPGRSELRVHGLNGALVRTIPSEPSLSALALLDSGSRRILLTSNASSAGALDAYWLPEEPFDQAPDRVARDFLTALASGDFHGLLPHADERLLGLLNFLQESSPSKWAALVAIADRVTSTETIFRGRDSAEVLGVLPSVTEVAPRLVLVRSEMDGRWRVAGL